MISNEYDLSVKRLISWLYQLFFLVWLEANIDSFHKLNLISRHPVLRHHVTSIHYSTKMLYEFASFKNWSAGVYRSWDENDHWLDDLVIQKGLTLEELDYQ